MKIKEPDVYCPFCRSKKPMWKAGRRIDISGHISQQYQCKNKMCYRHTIDPLRSK